MKRFLYLGYYLKQMDWKKLDLFLDYTTQKTSRNKISILFEAIFSVLKYNISILEYFQFRFFEQTDLERSTWAGTGYMFEYQLQMNPKSERTILDDKTKFYKKYGNYFVHTVADIEALKKNTDLAQKLIDNSSGKIVFKVADGKCGIAVQIEKAEKFTPTTMVAFMEKNSFDLVEEFITQHPELNKLSPSAVNTVRIFTQLDKKNKVQLLGSRLRISVNSSVDNMAAGNMAAVIDETTGIVTGKGVYSDITKPDEEVHPVTGVLIVGFQVPFWKKTLEMVEKAALQYPQNRSIGWDIVITENGPGFIEGNHDWCKLLWQMPAKKGLKELLKPHIN